MGIILQETPHDHSAHWCSIIKSPCHGIRSRPLGQKGIHKLGSRNPVVITSGDKTQITVVGCVSAAGYCLPPMVIWDRKTLAPSLTVGEVPGTVYGLSPKGWMDQELFDLWFTFEICPIFKTITTDNGWTLFPLLP